MSTDDKHTLTKAEIAEEIFQKIGLSKTDGMRIITQILDLISDSLAEGKIVKIPGFASFEPKLKQERIGRNPKTGEEVMISPRRVVSFRSSKLLRDRINA